MRGGLLKKELTVLLMLFACLLLFSVSVTFAYQIDLEYYDALTLDTVTPKGIYKRVVMYLKAEPRVLAKISSVTYQLEGDFYKTRVTVKSRKNAFQFDVNTTTHIPVTVDVRFKGGKSTQLNKYVLLGTRKRQRDKTHNIHLNHIITATPDKSRGETDYEMDLLVEGSDKDLADLDYIEYYISKPYPKRVVRVNHKTTQFKYHIKTSQQLDVQGYAYFKDGSVIQLVRFLYFKYY